MNLNSNLAYALELEDAADAQAANQVLSARLYKLSSEAAADEQPSRVIAHRKRRLMPVSFKDNYSGDFRPFRVY